MQHAQYATNNNVMTTRIRTVP